MSHMRLSVLIVCDSGNQVMAGSGHLQTFRLLRFLRSRTSADGHTNYGFQMAVCYLSILMTSSDLLRWIAPCFKLYVL